MRSDGPPAHIFTPEQRALLRAAQNQLIPADGGMPAAGDTDGPEGVERLLGDRPELRRPVLTALVQLETAAGGSGFMGLAPDEQVRVLQAVEASHPDPFGVLVKQTYNAYYTNPAVQAALGYGAPPQPEGFALSPLDPARLERVKRAGKRWRDA